MSSPADSNGAVTVVKIGGSVLTNAAAYRRAAQYLAGRICDRPGERILAVVSAQYGETDRLLAAARDLVSEPSPETLDLLWSTGELRSVALLTLALQALGVRATGANVHQTGLTTQVRGTQGRLAAANGLRLRSLLVDADVVVVPGFLSRVPGDGIASLGRGGSDLSAVLFAAALGTRSCDLLKDVDGFYDADPHRSAGAQHLGALGYPQAIALARDGCELVQLEALEAARDLNVQLVIRSFDDARRTVVGQA